MLSGAYHWHNGVYNQVHSPPSVHRDMNEDVVLYSQRLRDAGYRQGYVGKWHACTCAGPLDFGFDEVADMTPAAISRSTEGELRIRTTCRAPKQQAARGSGPHDAVAGLASRSRCGDIAKETKKRRRVLSRRLRHPHAEALCQGHRSPGIWKRISSSRTIPICR